jgi:hypothetical protein
MRSQLFVAGVLIFVMGAAFYVLLVPLVSVWGIPFMAGGGVMALASFFLAESLGPVQPPEGYRFCVYCGTPVKLGADRCQHCNGVQPKTGEGG